jgi:peptidoglycan/xylan/chitin deacetylase (PgdA/CDA1 family)
MASRMVCGEIGMNAPYLPDMSLKGKIRRRITRFADRKPLPRFAGRYVSFTFDDFPKSAAIHGARELEEQDLRGTYYACAGQMGETAHFGEIFGPDDLERLRAKGHEIGCHTENHVDCAATDLKTVSEEVRRNQTALAKLGVAGMDAFAFPYGDVSFATKHALSMQYATLRGVQPGVNQSGTDANQLLSVAIEGGIQQSKYALSFLDKLEEKAGWLIFYTHDVRDNNSNWGCTPQLLRLVIQQARSRGFTIGPVSTIYQQIITENAK